MKKIFEELLWEEAYHQAQLAAESGEVPVGAVVYREETIIASGFNSCVTTHDPTAHAEIVALRRAAEIIGNYRLPECSMAITLEPCVMCSGAIFQSRLKEVVYATAEPKTGAAGSLLDIYAESKINHQTTIRRLEVSPDNTFLLDLQSKIQLLLPNFFKERRREKSETSKINAG